MKRISASDATALALIAANSQIRAQRPSKLLTRMGSEARRIAKAVVQPPIKNRDAAANETARAIRQWAASK